MALVEVWVRGRFRAEPVPISFAPWERLVGHPKKHTIHRNSHVYHVGIMIGNGMWPHLLVHSVLFGAWETWAIPSETSSISLQAQNPLVENRFILQRPLSLSLSLSIYIYYVCILELRWSLPSNGFERTRNGYPAIMA